MSFDVVVHRIEVPIDDQWHPVENAGRLLHVDMRKNGIVEVWIERDFHEGNAVEYAPKKVRVFGTGQPIVDARHLQYIGSVVDRTPGSLGALVWHVYSGGR